MKADAVLLALVAVQVGLLVFRPHPAPKWYRAAIAACAVAIILRIVTSWLRERREGRGP